MSDYEPVFDEFTSGADDILEIPRPDDDERDYDDAPCGCLFCNCINETEHGTTCDDCLLGVHTG